MNLSVREAASLLGRSPRTVRAQLARGDLAGRKKNGRWSVARQHLPLTEKQRTALAGKAAALRQTLEDALPSRLARTTGDRQRSLADLDAFRLGGELLSELRERGEPALGERQHRRIVSLLERGLLALAEAAQQYERQHKLEALRRARACLARVAGMMLLGAGVPPPEPTAGWLARLEGEVVPAVAGYARWVDRLGRSSR